MTNKTTQARIPIRQLPLCLSAAATPPLEGMTRTAVVGLLPLTRKRVNLDRRCWQAETSGVRSRSVALSARVRLRVFDTTRRRW